MSPPTDAYRKRLNSGEGTSERTIRTSPSGTVAGRRSAGVVCSRDQVVTVMVVMSEREPSPAVTCRTSPAGRNGPVPRRVPPGTDRARRRRTGRGPVRGSVQGAVHRVQRQREQHPPGLRPDLAGLLPVRQRRRVAAPAAVRLVRPAPGGPRALGVLPPQGAALVRCP